MQTFEMKFTKKKKKKEVKNMIIMEFDKFEAGQEHNFPQLYILVLKRNRRYDKKGWQNDNDGRS